MKVNDVLERLEDQPMIQIAKELGVHAKTIQRQLKRFGYEFNKDIRKWEWKHDTEPPSQEDILLKFIGTKTETTATEPKKSKDNQPSDNSNVNTRRRTGETKVKSKGNASESIVKQKRTASESDVKQKGNEGEKNEHSPGFHIPFTQSEIDILKQMVKEYEKSPGASQKGQITADQLHDRVKTLNSDPNDKKRKTIVINKDIGSRLDKMAKAEKIHKSDLMEIALLDLFEKYGIE